MTLEQFSQYWEEQHGLLIARVIPNLKQYVQNQALRLPGGLLTTLTSRFLVLMKKYAIPWLDCQHLFSTHENHLRMLNFVIFFSVFWISLPSLSRYLKCEMASPVANHF